MRRIPVLLLALFLLAPGLTFADPIVFDFEDFFDGDLLTDQLPGMMFTNALVATAGISLNADDFPPFSGTNVVLDFGGPMTTVFQSAVLSFGAYFTYNHALKIEAFDATDTLLGFVQSSFNSNAGGLTNELLQLSFETGIYSVRITGNPAGESFVMDNLTILPGPPTSVPEPGSVTLLAIGLVSTAGGWRYWRLS